MRRYPVPLFVLVLFLSLATIASAAQEGSPTPDPLADKQSGECLDFVDDVVREGEGFEDGDPLKAGSVQTKIWSLVNCGTNVWEGYTADVVTVGGLEEWFIANPDREASPNHITIQKVNPEETFEVSVKFTVPNPGNYRVDYWIFRPQDGLSFRWPFWMVFTSVR